MDLKHLFCNYFDNVGLKAKIPKLKSALLRATDEIYAREGQKIFIIRDFITSKSLNINLSYKNLYCNSTIKTIAPDNFQQSLRNDPVLQALYSSEIDENNKLFVGTIYPDWSRGWSKISKDKLISDIVSDFFHFASQYIYRGYQINLIGAILFTYNVVCHYNGCSVRQTREIEAYNKFVNEIMPSNNKRINRLKHYLNIINALDPYINIAIFHYSKACSLYLEYTEEAITNLDNIVQDVIAFLKKRDVAMSANREDQIYTIASEFRLNEEVVTDLHFIYNLRCGFTAHPSKSKWWDFTELYCKNIDSLFVSIKTLLIKLFQYENANRLVEPQPQNWHDWFINHGNILFDATWFHNIPYR